MPDAPARAVLHVTLMPGWDEPRTAEGRSLWELANDWGDDITGYVRRNGVPEYVPTDPQPARLSGI